MQASDRIQQALNECQSLVDGIKASRLAAQQVIAANKAQHDQQMAAAWAQHTTARQAAKGAHQAFMADIAALRARI